MSTTKTAERIYERHARAADRGRWSVEEDVAWDRIDPVLAHRHPEVLDQVREAAIVESFHPVNLGRLMRATWDDLDAGVVFSLEAFEGFKHFHALRRYLEVVDHRPRITDAELVEVRRVGAPLEIGAQELIGRLVDFMLSEHLAAYFFRRLADRAEEPVLADLLRRIAADEVRHAQSASDLLAKRIEADRALVPRVLEAAADFRHYGEEVVPELPVALEGDEIAIVTFAQRVERLCGVRLVEHLKADL